jgi:hypothetical protein
MLAVHGLYENGIVKVKEPVPNYKKCEVIVTFLPVAYKTKQKNEFLLADPNLKTAEEKNKAIDSLVGICEGCTLTLDDIKTERLKRK